MTCRDVLHVDAAGRDIGSNEHAVLAGGEALERGGALRLRAVAVDDVDIVAEPLQLFGDAVCAVLGAGEDEERARLFVQHLVEQAELLVLHHGAGAQLDLVAGVRVGADLDMHRIAHVVADHLAHVGVQRGGVAHGLAGAGKRADDAADGGQKAHVQHAVDFVEHQHLDRADGDGAAAEEVFETAGVATTRRGPRASWSSWVFSLRPPTTSTASFLALGTSLE